MHDPHLLDSFQFANNPLDKSINPDSNYTSFIAPFTDTLNQQMDEVVGFANGNLTRSKPESTMGNFVAESLRDFGSYLLRTRVDVGLMNLGGLRTDLSKGDLKIGSIFELMPFENRLTIATISGSQLSALLNEISIVGGEPISGVRFRIENNSAKDVIVSGNPIVLDSTYTIATSDYLMNGGGNMPTLWKLKDRQDTNYLIRDIIIEYVKNRQEIDPITDGRVR